MSTIEKRKIGAAIVWSLVTCGIYYFWWKYQLVKSVRILQESTKSFVGEFICFAFVPFYSLYWWYSRGEVVRGKIGNSGEHLHSSKKLIFFAIFLTEIFPMAIMQNDLNILSAVSEGMSFAEADALVGKSKTISTVAIVLVAAMVVLFVITLVKTRVERAQNEEILGGVSEFLEDDAEFSAQYGNIEQIKLATNAKIEREDANHTRIPCHVLVESGKEYMVWVSLDRSSGTEVYTVTEVRLMGYWSKVADAVSSPVRA